MNAHECLLFSGKISKVDGRFLLNGGCLLTVWQNSRVNTWDKVLKSGPSEICGRQPLKNLKGYRLLKVYLFPCGRLLIFAKYIGRSN